MRAEHCRRLYEKNTGRRAIIARASRGVVRVELLMYDELYQRVLNGREI